MQLGKEIGSFSTKTTSMTVTPGDGDALDVSANVEGSAKLDGANVTVVGTVIFKGDAESGTLDWTARGFLESGGAISGKAHGTYQLTGPNIWQTTQIERLSDGRVIASRGEIDLAKRAWTGKIFDCS